MKQLTQEVFDGALPQIKSAVMDSDGIVWLFECLKKHLTPNHRSWVSDIETAFYFHSGMHDATDWQNSAIDRAVIEIKPGYTCGDCGYHHEPHQCRTTFCEGCDALLS